MEELFCIGTPAQIAQTILDFLRQDHELVAFANAEFYDATFETLMDNVDVWRWRWPTFPPDAPSIGIHVWHYLYDLPVFERLPNFVDGKRELTFHKYPLDSLGEVGLLALGDHTRLLAGQIRFVEKFAKEGAILRYVESSMPEALAPIWERVKAELSRLGLVIEVQSTPATRDGDARKPWENIPDVGWNRRAVELWHAGYTAREIARMIDRGLAPKTIANVISNLRGIYGTDVVPERRAKSRPG
jgi:hypothetical protein